MRLPRGTPRNSKQRTQWFKLDWLEKKSKLYNLTLRCKGSILWQLVSNLCWTKSMHSTSRDFMVACSAKLSSPLDVCGMGQPWRSNTVEGPQTLVLSRSINLICSALRAFARPLLKPSPCVQYAALELFSWFGKSLQTFFADWSCQMKRPFQLGAVELG